MMRRCLLRKVLRKIYQGIGVAAAALTFQACPILENIFGGTPQPEYGMPVPMYGPPITATIYGQVFSGTDQKPVPGINITVKNFEPCGFESCPHYDISTIKGNFLIYVPWQENYTLEFKDVDGPYNGGDFETKELEINSNGDTHTNLKVYLKEKGTK